MSAKESIESGEGMGHEAEKTLRLLAALPPPEELTDRVHARLYAAQRTTAKRGFWSHWLRLPAQRFQFAAAAALVLTVSGSAWMVHLRHWQASSGARTVQPVAPGLASGPANGRFGIAGTARVPNTLNPILVPARPAAHRKHGAGHALAKAASKPSVPPAPALAGPNP